MDTMSTRQLTLLESIVGAGRIAVAELAGIAHVSTVTIRKDLDDLEARGLIRRERGVAMLVSPDDPAGRLAYHYAEKVRIAAAAAATVNDGETVMIEAGSCCAILAEQISIQCTGITIVTNSAFIAQRLGAHPMVSTVLLGGEQQHDSRVLVGPMVELCARQFIVDRLFIGTDGFTPSLGFTARDYMRATAVRALASRAERVVVLTESEKLGRHGPVPLLDAHDVAALWTDSAAPDAQVDALTGSGVEVVTVAADGTAVVHPAQARPEPDHVVGGDSAPTALTVREEPS
mgnify:FL=1